MSKALLKVPKSQAIALFVSMGFATAKKWSCKKLTEKINAIDAAPDEPLDTEELDKLMDDLMEFEEAVVEDEEADDDDDADADLDEGGDDDDDGDDDDADDGDGEEVKSKKDKKGKKEKKGKKDKKDKKDKKEAAEKKESLDSATLALIKTKPMKIESLVKALLRAFPDKDEETLTRTTLRRVSGHLQGKYGVEITKSKNGAYSVEE